MTPTILRGLWRAPRLNLRAQRMGRRSASLLKGRASAQEELDSLHVNAHAAPQQADQPFTWTILLTTTGLLRWRSVRTVPDGRPEANSSTTAQVLLASTRLGIEPVRYKDRNLRNDQRSDEAPAPLTPDDIEAREDLDFYLAALQREREQETHYARVWVPRLRRLGLIGPPRIPGLPTEEGTPCTCPVCSRQPTPTS